MDGGPHPRPAAHSLDGPYSPAAPDVEKGGHLLQQQHHHHAPPGAHHPAAPRLVSGVVLAGMAYALSSGMLTLLNKHALGGFGFAAPNALLCFQCALTMALIKACEGLRLIKPLQPLKWELVRLW